MKRIWNMRLNLDKFNSALAILESQQEQSEFLMGMRSGCNGGNFRENLGPFWSAGFALGAEMRAEAEVFSSVKSAAGSKSAEVRKNKYGYAQPQKHDVEHSSNTARTQLEHTSEQTLEHPLEQTLEPTTIYNLQTTIKTSTPLTPQRGERSRKGTIGDYSGHFEAAWTIWGAFRAEMAKIQDQFPTEKRFMAKSAGSKEGGYKAWQSHLGKSARGAKVDEVLLGKAVRTYAAALFREARNGVSYCCPMFSTALNKPNFADAIVYEATNAAE